MNAPKISGGKTSLKLFLFFSIENRNLNTLKQCD